MPRLFADTLLRLNREVLSKRYERSSAEALDRVVPQVLDFPASGLPWGFVNLHYKTPQMDYQLGTKPDAVNNPYLKELVVIQFHPSPLCPNFVLLSVRSTAVCLNMHADRKAGHRGWLDKQVQSCWEQSQTDMFGCRPLQSP